MQVNRLYGNAKRTDRSSPEILLNKHRKAFGRTKYGAFEVKRTF